MTQLVIAMIVLAIACDSGRPSWVAPAPAAPTETAPGNDHHKRAAALERLRTKLAGTKRARTAVEADAALTNAYVDLEIA